jgi:hypothetical protein
MIFCKFRRAFRFLMKTNFDLGIVLVLSAGPTGDGSMTARPPRIAEAPTTLAATPDRLGASK